MNMNMEIVPLFPQEAPTPATFPAHASPAVSAPADGLNFAAVFAAMRDAMPAFGFSSAVTVLETSATNAPAPNPGSAQETDADDKTPSETPADDATLSEMNTGDAAHWAAAAASAMIMGHGSVADTSDAGAWLAAVIGTAAARSPDAMNAPVKENDSLLAALSFMGMNASSQSGGGYGFAALELNANMPGAAPTGAGASDALDIGVPLAPSLPQASMGTSEAFSTPAPVVPDAVPLTQAADLSPSGTPPEAADPLKNHADHAAPRGMDAQLQPPDAVASRMAPSPPLRIVAVMRQVADAPEAATRIQDADTVIVSRKAPLPVHEDRLSIQDDRLPGVKDAFPLRAEGASEATRAGASAPVASWVTPTARGAPPTLAESPAPPQAPVGMESIGAAAVRSVRYLASRGGDRSLTVRLVPESLGEMRVEVRAQGEEMLVRIVSANPSVRESIQAQVHDLRQSLAREGIEVTRVDIAAGMSQNAGQGGRHPQEAVPQHIRWASPGRAPYDGAPEAAAGHAGGRGRPHHGVLNVFV